MDAFTIYFHKLYINFALYFVLWVIDVTETESL